MKRIKRFESFINESYLGGSRAPLYHTSPITNSYNIIEEDRLKSPTFHLKGVLMRKHLISFTRNKDFIYSDGPITFVIDADKLGNKFKIYPMDYFVKTVGSHMKPKSFREADDFEYEEAVEANEITDLHKYLLEIRINDSFFMFYKTYPRNTREEYRESYEDLVKELINYKKKFGTKIVFKNGKEWTLEDMEKESSEFLITENIYHKDSGNRMYVSKAADEDDYKVYYSSYNPMGGFKDNANKFSDYLKNNGIQHSEGGGNYVKMNKENVDKLKRSMLTLESESSNLIPVVRWASRNYSAAELQPQKFDWGGFESKALCFTPFDGMEDPRINFWKELLTQHHKKELVKNFYYLDLSDFPLKSEAALTDFAKLTYSSMKAERMMKEDYKIHMTLSQELTPGKPQLVEIRLLEGCKIKIVDYK